MSITRNGGMNTLPWIHDALATFHTACDGRLAGPGAPEAALATPIEQLLTTAADKYKIPGVVWHPETRRPDLGVRLDYAVTKNGTTIGYLELKRPQQSIDPGTFTGHNRVQWERLRNLPNLIYSNGRTWALYRNGELVDQPVHLDDTQDTAQALDNLLRSFLGWHPAQLREISTLVDRLAPLTRSLRFAVIDQLKEERKSTGRGEQMFNGLKRDWRKLLFPGATDETFADGYAQTVVFALLLARTENIPLTSSLHEIGRHLGNEHALMGRTLQLLTDHIDGRFKITLDLLQQTIAVADWPAIRSGNQDAYLHLYEKFLAAYDPELRKNSGSYYTPRQVVDQMVRLTEDVLRTRLGKRRGFDEPDVAIVDPAMGTGTFLHTIIERVAAQAMKRYGDAFGRDAISRLAERLWGIELQMGPYAVAEMRTADLIRQYGAELPPSGLKLCVNNTLDDPYIESGALFTVEAIADSRRRANELKANTPVTVVIGNPPYDDKAKGLGGWVESGSGLMDAFKYPGNGRFEHTLKNLYLYFWRWATWKVFDDDEPHRQGVVCFITPSGFATGPGGKGMRDYLRRTCSEGWIIDVTPEGIRPDAATRIFPGVAQPLAICIFIRKTDTTSTKPARIRYRAVQGKREAKYQQLAAICLDDEDWLDVRTDAVAPFIPQATSNWDTYPALSDLFPWGAPGCKTNRGWVTSPSQEILRRRWLRLLNETNRKAKAVLFKETDTCALDREQPALPGRPLREGTVDEETNSEPELTRMAMRGLDRQWIIADKRVIDRPREELWAALQDRQVFLVEQSRRAIASDAGVMGCALLPDSDFFSEFGGRMYPMLHPDGSTNTAPRLLQLLAEQTGHEQGTVHDLAAYVMAVTGHAGYTTRFASELAVPGIRVPLTADAGLWKRAVTLGEEMLWASTYAERYANQDSGRPPADVLFDEGDPRQVRYVKPIQPGVPANIRYQEETQTLHLDDGVFGPVTPAMWSYRIGGKQVVKQWFGYRKLKPTARKTSPLDEEHEVSWPGEWTVDLLELLSVVRRLTDLAPAQVELLSEIVAGPTISMEELTAAGALPVDARSTKPRYKLDDALFA